MSCATTTKGNHPCTSDMPASVSFPGTSVQIWNMGDIFAVSPGKPTLRGWVSRSLSSAVLVPLMRLLTDVECGQEGLEHVPLPRGEHLHDVLVHVRQGLGTAVRPLQIALRIRLRCASTHPFEGLLPLADGGDDDLDRKSTRLNSSHSQ